MTNKERGLPPLSKEDLALLKNYVASQGLPEQVEAITSEAPLTVVGAGAGTGKTWTLAWRFVWTVLTREDVRHMLTLTFTEKAASEMRRRIAALLADLEPALAASHIPEEGFPPQGHHSLPDREEKGCSRGTVPPSESARRIGNVNGQGRMERIEQKGNSGFAVSVRSIQFL